MNFPSEVRGIIYIIPKQYGIKLTHDLLGVSMGPIKFGVGDLTNPSTRLGRVVGTMGLLPPTDAKSNEDFILKKLLDKKLVKSRAFSIALRNKGQGALTFGGYDTSKFSGPLEKFAIQPTPAKQYVKP